MGEELFGDRLLVIDDEPALSQVVKRVAQSCGFEVVVTEDATSQLEKGFLEELQAGNVRPQKG